MFLQLWNIVTQYLYEYCSSPIHSIVSPLEFLVDLGWTFSFCPCLLTAFPHFLSLSFYCILSPRSVFQLMNYFSSCVYLLFNSYLKYGPWTRNISISWELIRNANSWAPPKTHLTEWGPGICVLQNSAGDCDAH